MFHYQIDLGIELLLKNSRTVYNQLEFHLNASNLSLNYY